MNEILFLLVATRQSNECPTFVFVIHCGLSPRSTDDDDKENCTSSMMADDDRQLQLLDNYKGNAFSSSAEGEMSRFYTLFLFADYIPPHCQITLKCTKEVSFFKK
jgi:hypothetical protein